MIKWPHYCAFILGSALVLLAAVLVLRVPNALDHRATNHRAATAAPLAQAISHLGGGCATCHSTQAASPHLVAQSKQDDPGHLHEHEAYTLISTGDAALLDLGWRLLSLPEREQERAGDVIAAYVALVEVTRAEAARPAPIDAANQAPALAPNVRAANAAPPLSADTLARRISEISDLAAWVRLLENRAQPLHWDQPDSVPAPVVTAAYHTTPTAPPVALTPPAQAVTAQSATWIAAEPPDLGLAYEIIFGTQRRGPPAGALASHLESVLGMRDCAVAAYAWGSLSFFGRSPSTQQPGAADPRARLTGCGAM